MKINPEYWRLRTPHARGKRATGRRCGRRQSDAERARTRARRQAYAPAVGHHLLVGVPLAAAHRREESPSASERDPSARWRGSEDPEPRPDGLCAQHQEKARRDEWVPGLRGAGALAAGPLLLLALRQGVARRGLRGAGERQGAASLMRAIVTGGAGLIGSHVVDALLARGDEGASCAGMPSDSAQAR
jgi:hypothetical protein